jgi:hypothetical protein
LGPGISPRSALAYWLVRWPSGHCFEKI